MKLEERFWSKVDVSSDNSCWNWKAGINSEGYGWFWKEKRPHIASRISWELKFGPVPENMIVCHTCDNTKCVNPSHLWLGTDQDNTDDKIKKGRDVTFKGEQHGMAKLSEKQILEIRKELGTGKSGYKIAKEYNVTRNLIYSIKHRRLWKHI